MKYISRKLIYVGLTNFKISKLAGDINNFIPKSRSPTSRLGQMSIGCVHGFYFMGGGGGGNENTQTLLHSPMFILIHFIKLITHTGRTFLKRDWIQSPFNTAKYCDVDRPCLSL